MTLKRKTIVFSGMALVVLGISFYIFQGYRDTNKRLVVIVSLLNSIRESAHMIGDESRYPHPDLESIKKRVDVMPEVSLQFQGALRSETKPAPYIDVEISFLRLGRIIDKMIPGQLIEEPVLRQIHNETFKIEEAAGLLMVVSLRQIEALQARAERMIWLSYSIFISYILGTIYFFVSMLTGPVLSLSRQVAEISEGRRSNISPLHRRDELGVLSRFIQKAISDLAGKNQQLNLEVLERKQAEEKYKQTALTLENVFNSANPISITNLDFELLQANKAYYDIWPSKATQTSGQKCYESRPGPICNEDSCTLRQVVRAGTTIVTETVKHKANGEMVNVIITARPFRDTDGKLIGVVHSFQDITERIRAEDALAEERERLAVTLRSIGDGVITTDINGHVLLLNKVCEELTGWSHEEALGKPLSEVFHILDEKTRLIADNPVVKVLQSGKTVGLANHTLLVARDGTERSIADSAAPILDKNKRIIGVVLVFRDVTEERIVEEELLKIKKLESIGVLAGGIAHDFNNILTAIMGSLNLASFMVKPGDGVHKILKDAEKASCRAKNLTQQLLTFSKGGAPIKRLASIVEVIKDSANFILRGSSVKCEYDFEEPVWPVEIDPGLISQVIQNIILNASAAMPEGGIIRVSCRNYDNREQRILPVREERLVEVAIQDRGTGISPDLLDKIFDPYFTTKQEGVGLGLAICHSIISKHGGHISVESVPGHGATFKIYLVASDREIQVCGSDGEGVVYAQGTKRIMIMDDEETVRNVASMMLTHCGYQVLEVADGKEAIECYTRSGGGDFIDLIIMDITIPGGMGGKEAVKEILRINPGAKVIVASGYSNDPIMANYRNYGFKGAVAKPFTLEHLSSIIHRVVSTGDGVSCV